MARNLAHDSNSAGTESDANSETNETDDSAPNEGCKGLLNRRNYLRLGAATAAAVVGTGAANGAAAASDDHGMSFDRVVDAVSDLGWDPSGDEPVTESLRDNMQDGTLIELPPGTYLVDGMVSATDIQNWGVRGTGGDKGDARFVVPQGSAQRIFNVRSDSRNVLVENLTFDQYDTWETCIGNAFQVADNLLIRNVEYAGKTPSQDTGATSHLNIYVFDPDGSALIDGLVIKDPTELAEYPGNVMTLYCGRESKGTLTVRNSHFENCGSSGLYTSRCESAVRIENCTFKNIQNSFARISGEGSWAKDSTFVWDIDGHPNGGTGTYQNTTGLTFESGFQGFTGGLVENCEFICKSSGPNSGCLKVDGSHGGITVRDCQFQVDADGAEPIWADGPGDSHMIDGEPSKPWDISLENVHVHGTGKSSNGNTGAVEIHGRDVTNVSNCCVVMDGDRDGVYFANLSGEVLDSNIRVPGEAVALENADADTANITHNECTYSGSSDGSSDDGGSTDDGYDGAPLTIKSNGEYASYEFNVSESVESNPEKGGADRINGQTAWGAVGGGGRDGYFVSGTVESFNVDGDVTVTLDGQEIAAEDVAGSSGSDDSSTDDGSTDDGSTDDGSTDDGSTDDGSAYPNDLTVFADEGADAFTYEIVIDGEAALVTDGENAASPASEWGGVGEKVVENDDGTVTVTGIVADGGGDSFTYEGEIVDFAADGPARVFRNGDELDLGLLTSDDTVRVFAKEGAAALNYEFDVSGDAALITDGENAASPASENGGVGEKVVENDDGTVTVTGIVADGGGDSFRTDGKITAFRTDGNPVVYRNGERFDWETLGLPRTVTIKGGDVVSSYSVTVSGDIEANPYEGSFDGADSIVGSTAEGAVMGGVDSYLFSGSVTDVGLKGDATLFVDGVEVDPDDLGLDHRLEVVGTDSKSTYGVTVDGELAASPDGDYDGTVDGTTASGTVESTVDKFLFSGDITAFELQGYAAVYVDGQQVDPARLTDNTDAVLANTFVVQGNDRTADYTFDVSGTVEKAPDLGSTEAADTITADGDVETVKGSVTSDNDAYRFSGYLTSMSIDGSASISFAELDG